MRSYQTDHLAIRVHLRKKASRRLAKLRGCPIPAETKLPHSNGRKLTDTMRSSEGEEEGAGEDSQDLGGPQQQPPWTWPPASPLPLHRIWEDSGLERHMQKVSGRWWMEIESGEVTVLGVRIPLTDDLA